MSHSTTYIFVDDVVDFPSSLQGVIYLIDNTTYVITTNIDLLGLRLVGGQNTTILGGSSENCSLSSTGLPASLPLIQSEFSLPIRNITITAKFAIDLDASTNSNQALDWFGVNFTNCARVGRIKGYSNFILTDGALLNSSNLKFEGTVGTVGFSQCIFQNFSSDPVLEVPADAVVSRRFRIIYSAFVITSTGGISVAEAAIQNSESFILDTVNFSGGGTYLLSANNTSDKSLFANCIGTANSGSIAHYYMVGNSAATAVSVINTFYKVAGSTTAGPVVEKFDLANNRATYVGSRIGFYKITAVLALTSGANNVIYTRIGKNGTSSASSENATTANAAGRAENAVSQDILQLSANDYIEVFVSNSTGTNNITVEDLSVVVERLN